MLKTEQILNAKFTPVSKGTYSADEVDAFLKIVAESYEALNGEKSELIKKISILADKIESYRNDEEAIKLSLLDAHRMAETINKNAQIKSDTLIGDAETRAQLIVDGANRQSTKLVEEAREEAKTLVENARAAVNSLTERAQNETDATISAAKEKAEQIVADAKAESASIVGESKKTYEYYVAEIARLKASAEEFKASMASLCNIQLASLDSIPVIEEEVPAIIPAVEDTEPVADITDETAVADAETEEVETELPFAQDIMSEIENEIAAIEESVEESVEEESKLPEEDSEDIEAEQVVYVPEEPEAEAVAAEEAEDEAEVEDLFSLIDDMSFEDIVAPDSIPASIDDIVPEAPAVVEAAEENIFVADKDETVEEDNGDDDDFFDGFKIDLDSITDDDNGDGDDDDDISSLFDSMFDD